MSDQNIEILRKETYLKMIDNSVGSKLFNSLYARFKDSGEIKDILNDGDLSCAFFVSNILVLFGALDKPRATVKSLMAAISKDKNYTAVDLDKVQSGDVVFYDEIKYENGEGHFHAGFVLDKDRAVSTDYKTKMISLHPINNRPILSVYRFSWN